MKIEMQTKRQSDTCSSECERKTKGNETTKDDLSFGIKCAVLIHCTAQLLVCSVH